MLTLALGRTPGPLTVLCLGSHSDDIEIGCGGTMLKLLSSRTDVTVHWVVFSASDERATEAEASAKRFLDGAAHVSIRVERFKDGFFPYVGADIKHFFEELKHTCTPDVIFTHYRTDRHQDHRVISDLAWNTWRNHLILEYEVPKYDGDLGSPNVFVELDEATCRRKASTITSFFQTQRNRHWFTDDTFLALLRLRGIEAASPTGYAEAFYCRKAVVDM
jgi:LmbE family N-acetylglucosaminyl deacetylase